MKENWKIKADKANAQIPDCDRRPTKRKKENHEKKAPTAFILFSTGTRPQLKEDNPSATFGDIAKMIAYKWTQLEVEDKAVWMKKADEAKEAKDRQREEKWVVDGEASVQNARSSPNWPQ